MKAISFLFLTLLIVDPISLQAQASDEDEVRPPPMATSQDSWLFSWSSQPRAASDPKAFVAEGLARAQDCVAKIAARDRAGSGEEIAGCEGNGMRAGPGIYACDDPFTSHDYGNTLVMMKAKPGNRRVANVSGLLRPADDIDSAITGNANIDGVLYDFRANEAGGYALAIRGAGLLRAEDTVAVKVPVGARKEFHFHEPFACKAGAALPEVLAHWGDHLDFLSLTYNSDRDPAGQGFEKNGALNEAGRMAALVSNIVAVTDDELAAKIKALSEVSPKVKESLSASACEDASHISPRMCLSSVLFDSLAGNEGTNDHPTYAWSLADLKGALLKLKVVDSAAMGKVRNRKELVAFLAARFARDAHQAQRAEEAFACMKAVRNQLRPKGLDAWAAAVPAGMGAGVGAGAGAGAGGASAR